MSPATKGPKVDLDQIAERCEALKLLHAAQTLPELLEEASRDDLTPMHFLDRVYSSRNSSERTSVGSPRPSS